MKTLGLILMSVVLFASCSEAPQDTNVSNLSNMKVVVIDSCEYIQYHTYMYDPVWNIETGYTHKGNCKYCIERNKSK